MDPAYAAAAAYVDAHRPEILRMWEEFVRCESCTGEPEAVTRMAGLLGRALQDSGAPCQFFDGGGGTGRSLSGTWNGGASGAPVLLAGHLDTVFPTGSWEGPLFSVEDGVVRGPGCCDMKGGAVIAVWILRALAHAGFRRRPVRLLFVSDEEVGHAGSRNVPWMQREAAGAAIALNLEPGRPPNGVTIGRKGCLRVTITTQGVPGHSGNCFAESRNALVEMAHKIVALEALTDLSQGVTVSCNVIQGGTVFNCVAGSCRLEVDCRFETGAQRDQLRRQITALCAAPHICGVTTQASFQENNLPFETTAPVRGLHAFADGISRRCGFGALDALRVGGSSDVSYLTAAGIPALCSAGVVGGGMHTQEEWADLASLFQRIKLWTAIILHLDELSPA